MAKEVVGFDLTISVTKSTEVYQEVAARLRQVFKEWAFQREVSETGYDHWQVRGKLFKPKSEKGAAHAFGELVWSGHWTITSATVHSAKCFNYIMKADTRKDGPWSSKDAEFEDPPPLTLQLKEFYAQVKKTGFYPWQEKLASMIQVWNGRKIICIVETTGNNGKSVFVEHLEYTRAAYEVPALTVMEDIMQCCMCIASQKVYCIDMPRSMKKDKLWSFYAGLEALKNGVMYDKRHSFKKRRIDRPNIVVFTNCVPDRDLLSEDRWDIYFIASHDLLPAPVAQGAKPE